MMDFQQHFLASDPYSNHIENNWQTFKTALHGTMIRNIPQRLSKKCKHLPWITHILKAKMRQRKSLYNTAKRLQTDDAWSKYRKVKNEISKEIKEAHERYQNNLLIMTIAINSFGNMLNICARTILEFLHLITIIR